MTSPGLECIWQSMNCHGPPQTLTNGPGSRVRFGSVPLGTPEPRSRFVRDLAPSRFRSTRAAAA
eukprot:907899-Rhodomonas_salina.9